MKTKTFFFVLLTAIIFSCQKDLCLTDSPNERLASTLLTKSLIPPHETPYFDWEDTSYIHICNYGDVLLPWVGGAESNIAPEILHDYHRAHGWEMLYNVCSDSVLNVNGKKNYLIFYNKIRGILRIYYYNTNTSSTGSKDTFAHITTSSPSRIWDFGQGIVAKSSISSESGTYAPNRAINPYTSSLTMGWNCFETELAYDAVGNSDQNFTITLLDQIHYDFQFKGILTGSAAGRVMSPVTSSSGSINLQQYASVAKSTLGEISTIVEKASNTKVEAAAVIAIVSAGIGIIQNLWGLFSRDGASGESVATDNLTITLDTKLEGAGSIESATATVGVFPVSNLPLPGTPASGTDTVIPHYNQKLGAWNIVNNPTVMLDNEYTPVVYEVLSGPPNYRVFGANHERYHSLSPISVVVNPETLQYLEGYDYEVSYQYVYKYDGEYVGRNMNYLAYLNLGYCTPINQYLKKCIYEEEFTPTELQNWLDSYNLLRLQQDLEPVKIDKLNDEQRIKTILFDVDSEYADRKLNDVNQISFQIDQYTQYNQALQLFNQWASYPAGDSFTNYIAKVKMVFHIKEEYGGGDYVSVKTYVPTVQSRVVSHNITTYFPYYMRPEGEGECERWLHRWDWVL